MKLVELINKKIAIVVLLVYVVGFGYPYASHFFKYNISDSVTQKYWFVDYGNKNIKLNDYLVAKFFDPRFTNGEYEYVIKKVGGLPGEIISVAQNIDLSLYEESSIRIGNVVTAYTVNNEIYPVYSMLSGFTFTPLTASNIRVPENCYFVHGTHQPSFDSRYKEFGFICESQIEGIAYPIFNKGLL